MSHPPPPQPSPYRSPSPLVFCNPHWRLPRFFLFPCSRSFLPVFGDSIFFRSGFPTLCAASPRSCLCLAGPFYMSPFFLFLHFLLAGSFLLLDGPLPVFPFPSAWMTLNLDKEGPPCPDCAPFPFPYAFSVSLFYPRPLTFPFFLI